MTRHPNIRRTLMACVAALVVGAAPLAAQEVNTRSLSENGWFSDDTRADGSGSEVEGTDLVSDTLTDDPEAGLVGTAAHSNDIKGQIRFLPAPAGRPVGTHDGVVRLIIDGGGGGKSSISHRKDDGIGHGSGDLFAAPGFFAEYSWVGTGTSTVTAALKVGFQTAEYGITGVSSRTGENAWDKLLIYEPGNLNGGLSDGTWYTESTDLSTGRWWFFDRTAGAGTIGTPMTLSDMATSSVLVGGGPKTVADVYALITAPTSIITSVQFGIGSGNAGGDVAVNQLECSFYRAGMTTTFGCADIDYEQGFETDVFGWNVFTSPTFDITRVPSGTNGVTSAGGAWHAQVGSSSAGNWGGYSGVCGCSSTDCAAPSSFPAGGYVTSIDVFLDVDGGWANDTRFDFTSAINKPDGSHRRDFVFTGQFLDSGDASGPSPGQDRFVFAAGNNVPGWPVGGVDPIAITTSGWYTLMNCFRDAGGVLAVDFIILDPSGEPLALWTRSDASDVIGVTVGGNRYGWFATNGFAVLACDNARRTSGAKSGELLLTSVDCQDDVDPSPGKQVSIDLSMAGLGGLATGFQAFVEYDVGVLAYRADLSSYAATPFPLHIGGVVQPDDGRLELDGSDSFGGLGSSADALLATLVFDVVTECGPVVPASFEVGGAFASELSFLGEPIGTALTDADPVTLDDTAPVLSGTPADITRNADAGSCAGAIVTFTDPTAVDNCDPSPSVVCVPPSGSLFPIGTTTVTCTATDACGNASTSMFDVTVTGSSLVDVVVELEGSMPTSRCIRFQTDDCTTVDVTLSFVGTAPAVATATIEVPCGAWTELSAKDRQHSQWGVASLSIVGSKFVATTHTLTGGDTDDDGDVDINDVTLFLAQLGGAAVTPSCPWDGARDADFSNNGVVGSEDYTFLAANWLSQSSSGCVLPLVGRSGGPTVVERIGVHDETSRLADLNRDGFVDVLDVEAAESAYGLSGALSARMRR